MGWHGRGKYGIQSGRTFRKNARSRKLANEYAIVKEAFNIKPDGDADIDFFNLDDGIPLEKGQHGFAMRRRGYPNWPMMHSMNKHKRWQLPQLVQDEICNSEEEIFNCVSEACTKHKAENQVTNQRCLTIIERYTHQNSKRTRPDCFRFTSCKVNDQGQFTVRSKSSRKHGAYVGDLDTTSRVAENEENTPHIYYEFLQPPAKQTYPNLSYCENHKLYRKWDLAGVKSKKKCKGRRNKAYRHGISRSETFDDTQELEKSPNFEVDERKNTTEKNQNIDFAIGAYIDDLINNDNNNNNQKNTITSKSTNDIKLYGKGDAVYLSTTTATTNEPEPTKGPTSPHITNDKKLKLFLNVENIEPFALNDEFSDRYIEAGVTPRSFIIKNTNIHNNWSILFKIPRIYPGELLVETEIALSVTDPALLKDKIHKRMETEINLKNVQTIKNVVDIVETECGLTEKRPEVKRKMSGIQDNACIGFIHDLYQEKMELCTLEEALSFCKETVHFKEQNSVTSEQNVEETCGICYTDDIPGTSGFARLDGCGHIFCNDCWSTYITSSIEGNGIGRITCPSYNCDIVLTEALVWSCTNSKLYQTYLKLHKDLLLNSNPSLKACPAPNCTKVARVGGGHGNSLPVHCECGELWCYRCQDTAHWPATCAEAESFRKRHGDYEEYKKTVLDKGRIKSVMVKRCPSCRYPIDKNMGCSYMTCRCGIHFCWECLTVWDNDHEWPCTVQALEEVQLHDVTGNARYRKYCNLALSHLQQRCHRDVYKYRRTIRRYEVQEKIDRTLCARDTTISRHITEIVHFKCLAHFVVENTAVAIAVGRYKGMLSKLDCAIHTIMFIVDRLEELLQRPAVLADPKNVVRVKRLLTCGKRLIEQLDVLVRANRKPPSKMRVEFVK